MALAVLCSYCLRLPRVESALAADYTNLRLIMFAESLDDCCGPSVLSGRPSPAVKDH